MSTRDLLIEIGTEELPPKALNKLSAAFTDGIAEGLQKADLKYTDLQSFASPRRLAVLVKSLDEQQPDKTIERPLMMKVVRARQRRVLHAHAAWRWNSYRSWKPIRAAGWCSTSTRKVRPHNN